MYLYNGKGRISKIPKLILDTLPNYEFNIITRSKPTSREEYFEYLLNSDGLITFDEISQTNLEAVSLGIPVFIANKFFPEESISQFILTDFKKYFTSSPNEFLRLIKRKNIDINTFSKKYLESCNNKTLKKFTDILSNKDLPLSVNAKKLDQFKSFTNSLIRKRKINPLINSGQSPGSLFFKIYIKNIRNKRKIFLICLLIRIFDELGIILNKFKLVIILEVLIIKFIRIFKNI